MEEEGREAAPGRAVADAFRVTLPASRPGEPPFEGPLDLLLHLVKEHQLDVFDIPIANITESYLDTLKAMRDLDDIVQLGTRKAREVAGRTMAEVRTAMKL